MERLDRRGAPTKMEDIMSDEESVQAERILDVVKVAVEKGILSREQVLIATGKQKGRKVPELPEFTFPGSGITVRIRRLGPFTLDAMSQQARFDEMPPAVPIRMVNRAADDETPIYEPEENPADPEYKDALREYERKIEESGSRKVMDAIIEHAVVVDVDPDSVKSAREFLKSIGVSQEEVDKESDHSIYVKHVCVATTEDLSMLQKFVVGESMPTEERIQAHEDSFRGNVQGKTSSTVQDSVVRDETQHIPGLGNGVTVVGDLHSRGVR